MPPSKKKRGKAAGQQPSSGQLLATAAEGGDGAAVARLLAAGADPNTSAPARTPSGQVFQTTALCMTAGHGRLEAARVLLDGGADLNNATSDGFTALMTAAACGHLEVLRLLLGRGAALDAVQPDTGDTAFHATCFKNHAECAEELARAGCDVGLKDNTGETGREIAERMGHGPGRPGAVKRPSRFSMKIHFVWGFCMGAQGA
jgi:ankyrin repeat protein